MDDRYLRLAGYSLGHFFVDFACALLMLTHLWGVPEWSACVLLYNFCAFALQMPIGLLADRLDRNSCTAALGCALVALAWFFPGIPVLAAVTAGVGNGCFHVGGGIDVLNFSEAKAAPLAPIRRERMGSVKLPVQPVFRREQVEKFSKISS